MSGKGRTPEDVRLFPEPSCRLPDAAIPYRDSGKGRMWGVENLLTLDGERHFIRGVLPLPIDGRAFPLNFGCWVEVDERELERYLTLGRGSIGIPISGVLANALPPFGQRTNGLRVQMVGGGGETVPTILVKGDSPLAKAQKHGVTKDDAQAMIDLYKGPGRGMGRKRQAQRKAAFLRYLEMVKETTGLEVPLPEGPYPQQVALFGRIDSADLRTVRFLDGPSVDDLFGQADRLILDMDPPAEGRWAISIYNLDEERLVNSREFDMDRGHVQTLGPTPATVTLACLLAIPNHGQIALEPVRDTWLPVVGLFAAEADPRSEWLRHAAEEVRKMAFAPIAVEREGNSGARIWVTAGEDAAGFAMDALAAFELLVGADGTADYLGIESEEVALEWIKVRTAQLGQLMDFVTDHLEPGEADFEGLRGPAQEVRTGLQQLGAEISETSIVTEIMERIGYPKD